MNIVRNAAREELGFDPFAPYLGRSSMDKLREEIRLQAVGCWVDRIGLCLFLDKQKRLVQIWSLPRLRMAILSYEVPLQVKRDMPAKVVNEVVNLLHFSTFGEPPSPLKVVSNPNCTRHEKTDLKRMNCIFDPEGFGPCKIIEGAGPLTSHSQAKVLVPGKWPVVGPLASALVMAHLLEIGFLQNPVEVTADQLVAPEFPSAASLSPYPLLPEMLEPQEEMAEEEWSEDLSFASYLEKAKAKLPSDVFPATIYYLGAKVYSMDNSAPITVSDAEDAVLQAFIQLPSMDTEGLQKRSGYTRAPRILRSLAEKYQGIFAPAIRLPGKKSQGGFRVSIQPRRMNSA